jgi:hypothetical protein
MSEAFVEKSVADAHCACSSSPMHDADNHPYRARADSIQKRIRALSVTKEEILSGTEVRVLTVAFRILCSLKTTHTPWTTIKGLCTAPSYDDKYRIT